MYTKVTLLQKQIAHLILIKQTCKLLLFGLFDRKKKIDYKSTNVSFSKMTHIKRKQKTFTHVKEIRTKMK